MGQAGPLLRLHDILEFSDRIAEYISGLTFDRFADTPLVRDAVERNLERISEASRHIPDEMKAEHVHIPWRQVADIGNVLRHGYERIDDETIWNIARLDLPALRVVVDEMIHALETRNENG
jgi:uncharacterized protein with HEPN domain